jgi:lysyl-tRNA synthetase, class II
MVKRSEEIKVKMESSFIKMTCYHYGKQRLKIAFKNATYIFYHVPVRVYHELKESGSTGKYFNENIREKYNYELE